MFYQLDRDVLAAVLLCLSLMSRWTSVVFDHIKKSFLFFDLRLFVLQWIHETLRGSEPLVGRQLTNCIAKVSSWCEESKLSAAFLRPRSKTSSSLLVLLVFKRCLQPRSVLITSTVVCMSLVIFA